MTFILPIWNNSVDWFPSIYLFINHQVYRLILNHHVSSSVLSFIHKISAGSSVPYRSHMYSANKILKHLSSVVVYFMYRHGSIWANSYTTSSSKLKYILPLMSYVCKKYLWICAIATSIPSLDSILHGKLYPVSIRLGMMCLHFSSKGSGVFHIHIPSHWSIHIFSIWWILDKI